MPTAGASGNVTFRMTSSADDKGNSSIVAFKEVASRTISIANATVSEGNSGTTSLNFTVTLSASTSSTVTATYSTSNGTAIGGSCGTAGADYASVTGGAAGSTTTSKPHNCSGKIQ